MFDVVLRVCAFIHYVYIKVVVYEMYEKNKNEESIRKTGKQNCYDTPTSEVTSPKAKNKPSASIQEGAIAISTDIRQQEITN